MECSNDTLVVEEPSGPRAPVFPIDESGQSAVFYVDYMNGNDENAGSISAPFKTVLRGEFRCCNGYFVDLRVVVACGHSGSLDTICLRMIVAVDGVVWPHR